MSKRRRDKDRDDSGLYEHGPDSFRQEGVPQGKVTNHIWRSDIFENTIREYWVYTPAQYDETKPACVMVVQDGESAIGADGHDRLPIVFDNLMANTRVCMVEQSCLIRLNGCGGMCDERPISP